MSTAPFFSILLTSYNYGAYIDEAVRSVFVQSCANAELIAVDDGSTDSSAALLERLLPEAPFPAQLIRQAHAGQAAALNRGLADARGRYVALLDSDDAWAPEKLARMREVIEANPGAAVYHHALAGHDPDAPMADGDVFARWRALGNPLNFAEHAGAASGFSPTSGLLFPTDILRQVLPIPETLVSCPDAYLTRTCAAHGPVCAVRESLGMWRRHGENAGENAAFSFDAFWVPVVLPAVNAYYERAGIDFRFTYEPATLGGRLAHYMARGEKPAGRALGALWRRTPEPVRAWIRRQFGRGAGQAR